MSSRPTSLQEAAPHSRGSCGFQVRRWQGKTKQPRLHIRSSGPITREEVTTAINSSSLCRICKLVVVNHLSFKVPRHERDPRVHTSMDPTKLPPGASLSQIPAGRPPKAVLSNFTNPATRKAPVVATNVVFLAIATLFVCVRLYTRKFISRLLGPEDCDYDTSAFNAGNN